MITLDRIRPRQKISYLYRPALAGIVIVGIQPKLTTLLPDRGI
jgi:hypothetical protein